MKTFILACLALASFACAEESLYGQTAYGYLANVGIPEGARIKAAEEKFLSSRIVGGVPAGQGQYPYQVCCFYFGNVASWCDAIQVNK